MATPESVTRYFDLVNTDRFDELREIFAPDVVVDMAGARARTGIEAAVAYYPAALAPLPQHVDEPVHIAVSDEGRRVAVEIAFEGSTQSGRSVVFTAVDLFDLADDGRIERLRSFYDTADVARQLQSG